VSDLLDLDATGQLAALAAKRVSAVELLKLALARHEQTHGALNAVIAADLERALERAAAIDDARAKDAALGPLAGLPITVKDTFDVAGMPASSGLEALRRRKCEDATAVAHVRKAGAVIWGKTNIPVMAADWQSYNSLYGTTNNPWDPTRTPGGSSGGAAAALAARVTPLEVGSDIGGSLRVPASFCGVFSHKPTWGLVRQHGHVPPSPGSWVERDLNVVGPMARSARDLRLLLAADLERAGAEVVPIPSPVDALQLMHAYQMLLGGVLSEDLPEAAIRRMEMMRGPARLAVKRGAGPLSQARAIMAYTSRHREWMAADAVRCRLRHEIGELFESYDAVLAPITPVAAFPHDQRPFDRRRLQLSGGINAPYTAMLCWISLATALHLPATAIPAGQTADGLPVGAQLIGPLGGDAKTLALAQAIDEEIGGFTPPPL
jgi:amidase